MKLQTQQHNTHKSTTSSNNRPSTTHQNNLLSSKQMMQTTQNFQSRKSTDCYLPSVSHSNKNQVNTKSFSQHPYWEKEKLYDLCMKLQTSVNLLNHQVRVEKIKINKKDEEISKQKVLLKEVDENAKKSQSTQDPFLNPVYAKVRESTLMSNMRQENKALQAKLQEKEDELNAYKKKVKMTKIKEIAIEVEVYEREMIKMKQKLDNALSNAELNNKKDKVIQDYQEQLSRKNQRVTKLKYDNEKIIISSEAKVKDLNQEIENRNRTISRLEQEISKMKLKEYYHDKLHDSQRNKTEEELDRMLTAKTYQLFIALKKQGLTIETIQSQVLNKINPNDKNEEMKISFANYLIEIMNLTDLSDKAALLDYVTVIWQNEKELDKVKKKVIDTLKKQFDEEEKEDKKENDSLTLETIVKEKEKKLKSELHKIDSSRKGIVTFNTMRDIIHKAGIQRKEKEALILAMKSNSFNTMEYRSLLDLATTKEKYEYHEPEEVSLKKTNKDEEQPEINQNEINQSPLVKNEETKDAKAGDHEEEQAKENCKSNSRKINHSKSNMSEKNKKDDFPSFYQIVYNIKLNEFTSNEYFRSIVKLFNNVTSHLEQIEGIKQDDFLTFLRNKDIHIPPDECKRLFKELKCKNILEDDVLDAQKLETELAKYMNEKDINRDDNKRDEHNNEMNKLASSSNQYNNQDVANEQKSMKEDDNHQNQDEKDQIKEKKDNYEDYNINNDAKLNNDEDNNNANVFVDNNDNFKKEDNNNNDQEKDKDKEQSQKDLPFLSDQIKNEEE